MVSRHQARESSSPCCLKATRLTETSHGSRYGSEAKLPGTQTVYGKSLDGEWGALYYRRSVGPTLISSETDSCITSLKLVSA